MSSLITPNPFAIRLQHVSKIYKLHGSQGDQLIDVLGLQRFGFKTKTPSKEFSALSNISLEVPRGHR
ncbi:MAG: ABC transporter ATP-binding protein, partial [Gammaproteobacteria bacterium]|nr:ABC transporter ATP-binding protein [Gammaproteobacteria bacterium]